MSIDITLEDDDENFYYEVEEIIQMHVTDSGKRMFEIKWKNYDHSYENTWEPEDNLSCPSILKEFLEKNGFSRNPETQGSSDDDNEPEQEETEAQDEGRQQVQEKLARIASEEETTISRKKWAKRKPEESLEEKRKRAAEEKRQAEEKEREKTEYSQKKMAELREKNAAGKRAKEIQNEQYKIRQAELFQQRDANEASASNANSSSNMNGKSAAASNSRVNTSSSTSSSSSSPLSTTTAANNINGMKKADGSFGNLKRSNKPTSAPAATVDILGLVQMAKGESDSPKYPNNQLQRQLKKPKLALNTNPNNHTANNHYNVQSLHSATTAIQSPHFPQAPQQPLHLPQLPQSAQLHHSPQISQRSPPTAHRSPPTAHRSPQSPPPVTPSPSPPTSSQPLPKNINGNSTVAPMDWQLAGCNDPRSRQRLAEGNPDQHNGSALPTPPAQTSTTATQFEVLGIKRQISNSKDPRMRADNIKKRKYHNSTAIPTPFTMESKLYNGNKFISHVKLEGKQTCYHESKIRNQISTEVRVSHTLPLKALNTILPERPVSYLSVVPKDHNLIDLSKLKSYYQVNEMAGVIHHPNMTQALVILAEADLKKLTNLSPDLSLVSSYTQICALFIDELIPGPLSLSKEIDYDVDNADNTSPFNWNRVADYLEFPEQLNNLKSKANFHVYGQSDTTNILNKANARLKATQSSTTSYVMMFDRYNETIFSRNLTKHKRESATQIWEFGVPDFSYSEMIPASQVFPNNTGGFITTDMENIVHNPKIIEDICAQISKLNAHPTVYGEWKFIIPHNWLLHLKKLIKDVDSGVRVQNAVIQIAIALSSDNIEILKLWCAETEDMNIIQYMDRVAHDKYKTHQYFVYVDDISSVPSSQQNIFSIDFVKSSKIYSTFA